LILRICYERLSQSWPSRTKFLKIILIFSLPILMCIMTGTLQCNYLFFCNSFLLNQTVLNTIIITSGQFVIEFAAFFLCSKSDIPGFDCSSLIRSYAYFILFKLSIIFYVYVASFYFLLPWWSISLVCVVAYYFAIVRIVRGKVFRYSYYDLSIFFYS